ncbi:MAG: hypothetical protein ACLPID_19405 [Beijerinckiaceae bacterium]
MPTICLRALRRPADGTDKGSISQRAVLQRRAALVAALYGVGCEGGGEEGGSLQFSFWPFQRVMAVLVTAIHAEGLRPGAANSAA